MITQMNSLDALPLDEIGGFLLIALFYWFRFNSLKGTRSYTTAALYYSGVICFILPFVTAYVFVVALLESEILAVWILVGTWLLPWLPAKWRTFCHDIARIPSYAHRLKELLSTAPFELSKEDIPDIERKLARFGYQLDDFKAAQTTILQGRYLKLAAMMHHLEKWEKHNRTFMYRNSEAYHSMLQGFDLLSFKMIRAVKSVAKINNTIMQQVARSQTNHDDWQTLTTVAISTKSEPLSKLQSATQTAMGTMLEDLRKDIDFFLDLVLLFVARGVLFNPRSSSFRQQAFQQMGFKITQTPSSIFPSVFSAVFIMMLCSIAWFSIINISVTGSTAIAIPKILTVVCINLLCNFILVFYLKQRYAFANIGSNGRMPVFFILTVGLVAALLILPVRTAFEYFQFWDLHNNSISAFIQLSVHSLPFSLIPWVTGAMTALLAQDSMWSTIKSRKQRRILDGLIFGGGQAGSVLALWTVHRFMFSVEGMNRISIEGVLPVSFAIGFLMGFLVLAAIREGSSLRKSSPPRYGAPLLYAR
jgi:hypothetical protein